MHRTFCRSLLMFCWLTACLFSSTFLFSQTKVDDPAVYAAVNGLRVRTLPRLEAGTVCHMREGEMALFLNKTSNHRDQITLREIKYDEPWLKIRCHGGKEGWVYGGAVRFYRPQKSQTPVYATKVYPIVDDLSVRNTPSLSSSKKGTLAEGKPVTYLGRQSTLREKVTLRGVKYWEPWVLVQMDDGKSGWVYAGGLRIYQPVSSSPFPTSANGDWVEATERSELGAIKDLTEFTPRGEDESQTKSRMSSKDAKKFFAHGKPVDAESVGEWIRAWFHAYLPLPADRHGLIVYTENDECCSDYTLLVYNQAGAALQTLKIQGGGGDGGWSYSLDFEIDKKGRIILTNEEHETLWDQNEDIKVVQTKDTWQFNEKGMLDKTDSEEKTWIEQ